MDRLEVIDISEAHDKFEIINTATNAVTKVLIVGKQMDKIGKMISATIEARIQNEIEQEYKDLKASNWDFVNKISFYIQYSHSKNISDYLYILATLYAQRWLDVSTAQTFADALLAVHNQIDDYEMEIEYNVDIKYYSCLFAGVLHQLGLKHSGISIWKEFASEPEQFRDVKAG